MLVALRWTPVEEDGEMEEDQTSSGNPHDFFLLCNGVPDWFMVERTTAPRHQMMEAKGETLGAYTETHLHRRPVVVPGVGDLPGRAAYSRGDRPWYLCIIASLR